MVIQKQPVIIPPGADPQAVLAVPDDRADALFLQVAHKVIRAQFQSGGCLGFCQRQSLQRAAVFHHHQAGIVGSDKQSAVQKAGGVDHILRQTAALKELQEAVGHNLHDALPGGSKPEIPLIVGHDMPHRLVHGDIFQHMQSVHIQLADPVAGTDPEFSCKDFHPFYICK